MTNGAKLRKEEDRFEKKTHFNRDLQEYASDDKSCFLNQHWCQALLSFYKHINSYLQTEHKVIAL